MSIISKIAKNTAYQIVGKGLGAAVGLVVVGLMTRYLGQTGFGYYTTAIAFLQFFGVLIDFGLQMTATQMLAKPEVDQKKIFANILAIRVFSAIVFMGLATLIGWLMPYPLIIKQAITIASFSFFFISLQSVFISIFQNKMDMAKTAMAEIAGRIIMLAGIWLAVILEKSLLFIIGSIVLGNLLGFLILFFSAFRYLKISLEFDKQTWQKIWRQTWPLAITIALTLVYFRADTIVLSLFRPQNEVGIYGATYKVLEVLIQFPYLFLGLVLPIFVRLAAANKKLFNLALQKSFDFLLLLSVPMIFSIAVLGPKIMLFVAGAEFAISGEILRILIFAATMIYIGSLFGYAIVACGLQKKMVKFYLIDAIISLVLYLILIPIYSYWAAAWLTVFTEAFITFSAFYVLKKNMGISLELKTAGKAVSASLIMALVLLALINYNLLTLVLIGLIVYFAALYLLKGVSKETMMEIVKYDK